MQETIEIRKTRLFKRKMDTGDLIEQAKHDVGSFSAVYRSYAPRVYRYVIARVGNPQDAEDITSQVFEAVLRGLKSYDNKRIFSAWVFAIARNKVVDTYRAGGKEISLDTVKWLAADDHDPALAVVEKERLTHLMNSVRTLSPEEQELLHLRFAAGLKYAEIGDILGKNTGAVKVAVHRLIQRLYEELEQDHE